MIAFPSNPTPPPDPSEPALPPLQPTPAKGPAGVGWGETSLSSISSPFTLLPPLQPTPEKGPAGEGWGEGSFSYTFSSPYDSVSSHPSVPDSQLLEALTAAPSIAAYATAHSLPLTTLALWLQQPDIAEAHAALLELKALDRRHKHEQAADEAIEVLRETMHASEDPIERRRCANTILRAIARANRPPSNRPRSASEGSSLVVQASSLHASTSGAGHSGPPLSLPGLLPPNPTPHRGGGQAQAQLEPGGGASETPSSLSRSIAPSLSPSPLHPSSFSLHPSPSPTPPRGGGQAQAQLEPGGGASEPPSSLSRCLAPSLPPQALDAIAANKPAPTPSETITADPESLTDLAAARLAALPDPTGERLFLAIYDLIDLDLRAGPKTWDPFKRTLEASPFVTCRPTDTQPWTRTDHPVEHQGETATRRYTFTHPDGRTTNCTLALAHRGPSHYNATHWWITHLKTPNTS